MSRRLSLPGADTSVCARQSQRHNFLTTLLCSALIGSPPSASRHFPNHRFLPQMERAPIGSRLCDVFTPTSPLFLFSLTKKRPLRLVLTNVNKMSAVGPFRRPSLSLLARTGDLTPAQGGLRTRLRRAGLGAGGGRSEITALYPPATWDRLGARRCSLGRAVRAGTRT